MTPRVANSEALTQNCQSFGQSVSMDNGHEMGGERGIGNGKESKLVMQECLSIRRGNVKLQQHLGDRRQCNRIQMVQGWNIRAIIKPAGHVVQQFYWELSFRLKFSRLEIIARPPQVCSEISRQHITYCH